MICTKTIFSQLKNNETKRVNSFQISFIGLYSLYIKNTFILVSIYSLQTMVTM